MVATKEQAIQNLRELYKVKRRELSGDAQKSALTVIEWAAGLLKDGSWALDHYEPFEVNGPRVRFQYQALFFRVWTATATANTCSCCDGWNFSKEKPCSHMLAIRAVNGGLL